MRESGHLLGVKIDISMQDRGVDFFPVCCRAQLSLIGFVAGQLVGRGLARCDRPTLAVIYQYFQAEWITILALTRSLDVRYG